MGLRGKLVIADICLIPTYSEHGVLHGPSSAQRSLHESYEYGPSPIRPTTAVLRIAHGTSPAAPWVCSVISLSYGSRQFSIQNIWGWTHVHHRRQHMSRCPPMRCVALQAGLPLVQGGLYAPWGRNHVPIRLAAAGPDPSHGPSPPDP